MFVVQGEYFRRDEFAQLPESHRNSGQVLIYRLWWLLFWCPFCRDCLFVTGVVLGDRFTGDDSILSLLIRATFSFCFFVNKVR